MAINKSQREQSLYAWLKSQVNFSHVELIPGDASTRRYFRVYLDHRSLIAVDAPSQESNEAFVCIARAFLKAGLFVPEIIGLNLQEGFFLLSDLGDIQLFTILTEQNVQYFYEKAIQSILRLQPVQTIPGYQLPLFDHNLLLRELSLFRDWYLVKSLRLVLNSQEEQLLARVFELLIDSAASQPHVCVHRDFHSRNLMVLPDEQLGILDFQDAVMGPITYDLVSLIRDCYIQWPPVVVDRWLSDYWQLLTKKDQMRCGSVTQFGRLFDFMGLQRHLKVLGIFSRLYLRDGKDNYLKEIPRILQYVLFVCDKYHELTQLKHFITTRVLPNESHDFSSRAWQKDATTH
jgi:aminoglycoside/choline kinase family phosphotransferase